MAITSFKSTIERIRALETERRNLLLEIEELKRMADVKAKALENEITMLRDEVKSLRVLLSGEELDTVWDKKRSDEELVFASRKELLFLIKRD